MDILSGNIIEQIGSIHPTLIWIVIASLLVSFVLAFGIGANDVANSFGTSVGAGVLTLKQACILATIFETLGAVLIGAKVSDTIRKKIIDLDIYDDNRFPPTSTVTQSFFTTSSPHLTAFNAIVSSTLAADLNSSNTSSWFAWSSSPLPGGRDCKAHPRLALLMVGQLSSLIGCCGWLFIATFFGLPVSGTHSIVGATLGFALIAHGFNGINWWPEFARIVASWFISPVSSGLVSMLLFWLVKRGVLSRDDQLESGLKLLPLIYGITIVINVFSILFDAPPLLYLDLLPLGGKFIATFAIATLASVVIKFLVVPYQRNRITSWMAQKDRNSSVSEYQPKPAPPTESSENATPGAQQQPLAEPSQTTSALNIPNPKLNSVPSGDSTDPNSNRPTPVQKTGKFSVQLIQSAPKSPNDNLNPADPKGDTGSISKQSDVLEQNETSASLSQALLENRVTTSAPSSSPQPPRPNKKEKKKRSKDSSAPSQSDGASGPLVVVTDDEAQAAGAASVDDDNKQLLDTNSPQPQDADQQQSPNEAGTEDPALQDLPETARLFSVLQILTAIFGSFAHGGNDVSNAIGPLIGIWIMATTLSLGMKVAAPMWILAYGGAGISVGLWVWGRRVMQTLASGLTVITPSSGFCIELGTALTVLCASNLGLPISTTHCKVGSVVGVGWFRSRDSVHWSTFGNIALAWGVTVPASAVLGAISMLGLRFLLNYICV